MDPREVPSQDDGHSTTTDAPPPLRRRVSMDEDLFYQRVMIAPQRRPSQPPPYETSLANHTDTMGGGSRSRSAGAVEFEGNSNMSDPLPNYSSSILLEGVFSKKHEIENTVKRAEDRHWHTVFVSLNGTALNIYSTKKDWGWGKSRDGPTICPDNPPWIRKAKLEKSYSLLYADAGIAADYKKRRYVIRIRAETDQFLLCCIELSTFVKWLECLFAAIDISAPIDERDFPRDMSIPRIQRVRWFHGQSPTRIEYALPTPRQQEGQEAGEAVAHASAAHASRRRSSNPEPLPALEEVEGVPEVAVESEDELEGENSHGPGRLGRAAAAVGEFDAPPPRIDPVHRLSTSSYPNAAIDPHSGKWIPEHKWSSAHDLLYAKLCYSYLLFRSPRKSNYIINKGKQWFVDWTTGRMVRVLPPNYGEVDYFGPWQVVHTENRRI